MENQKKILWMMSLCASIMTGCQSFTGFDFDSNAIVGGGAIAGKDYIVGLQSSQKAREYFAKANVNTSQKKTVTPDDDQGTGVVWTDDGGIVIPSGCSIEFSNKGYCLDPHLPAPGAGQEMQFVRTASLIPEELQGTYKNLLKRSAAGDEDVKNNMQRLVWALRTAGSQDVMATHLTDRQREILSECAENGSFEDYVYRQEMYGKIVEELKNKFINKVKGSTSVTIGNVVYDAFDLLDPDKGKQKVEAHLQSLISMGLNLPVTQTGFNYGELENGIFTDIKGNGMLSFKAKIANSTSLPYTFYPMNYAAQVGSSRNMQGAFFAVADSTMRQRVTIEVPNSIDRQVLKDDHLISDSIYESSPIWDGDAISGKQVVKDLWDAKGSEYFTELVSSATAISILSKEKGNAADVVLKAEVASEVIKNASTAYDLGEFTGKFLYDGFVAGDWDQAARDTEDFVLDWMVRPWFNLGVWLGEGIYGLSH